MSYAGRTVEGAGPGTPGTQGNGGMSDEILRLYLSLDEESRQKADAFVHQLLEQNRRAAG